MFFFKDFFETKWIVSKQNKETLHIISPNFSDVDVMPAFIYWWRSEGPLTPPKSLPAHQRVLTKTLGGLNRIFLGWLIQTRHKWHATNSQQKWPKSIHDSRSESCYCTYKLVSGMPICQVVFHLELPTKMPQKFFWSPQLSNELSAGQVRTAPAPVFPRCVLCFWCWKVAIDGVRDLTKPAQIFHLPNWKVTHCTNETHTFLAPHKKKIHFSAINIFEDAFLSPHQKTKLHFSSSVYKYSSCSCF